MTGFEPNQAYAFVINESNNVKDRCQNVGKVFNPYKQDPPTGYIATIKASEGGNIYTTLSEFPLVMSGNSKYSILDRSCTVHKMTKGTKF